MRLAFACLLLLLALPGAAHAELRNQLADHPSPYLRLHAEDPVAWQTWGPEALEQARDQGRLLFVSSGYFSCHWCHVMQAESYSDPAIADFLNSHFVPVKVDRELEPALDGRLIDFVERTRGHAGWPLNVFVTPEGYPLVGTVYLPPGDFRTFLRRLAARWETERPALERLAAAAAAELAPRAQPGPQPEDAPRDARPRLLAATWEQADEFQGGFGTQSKFPAVPQLSALLALHRRQADSRLEHFLRLTLDGMAEGGLRDQLGGGFFRYVVDPGWRIPHFEKMLYDNALLAELYLEAAHVLDAPVYRAVGLDTLEFMVREMRAAEGGFIASLSAIDAEGEEGAYYLWEEDELGRLLDPPELHLATLRWGLTGPAEHEGGYHLVLARSLEQVAAALERPLPEVVREAARIEKVLRDARAERALPRDTKRLAAWNGLVLSALTAGARAEPRRRIWREEARALRDFIIERLWSEGRLRRSPKGGRVALEDYAYVARGLWRWAELTDSDRDRRRAAEILESAWARFHDPANGWRLDESTLLGYGMTGAPPADGPMPAATAILMRFSVEAGTRLERPSLIRRAAHAMQVDGGHYFDDPFHHATALHHLVSGRP